MLKEILRDFLLLYKNFFHWNVSKILIYIGAALFAVLLASPFFIIAISIGYSDPVNWQEIFGYYSQTGRLPITFLETIEVHGWNVLLNSSLILLGFGMLFIGWMQYLVTSSRLYLGYIDGEKIGFLANSYFSFAYFKKLTTFLGWFGLVLLIPVLIFVVISAIAFFGIGYENIIQSDEQFVIVVALSFVVCLAIFFYLTLRFGYGYLILCDEKNYPEKKSGLFYVKESSRLTKSNMLKIVGVTLLFAICLYLPIEVINYIVSEILKNDVISIVWGILAFLLFSLSYEMLFTSMYRRILLKNNQKEISEEKQEIV